MMWNWKGKDVVRRRLVTRAFIVAVVLLAFVVVARFSYLRITRRPVPRDDYWREKLAELNPSEPGMMPFHEVVPILNQVSQWTSVNPVSGAQVDFTRVLKGPWDSSANKDIDLAIRLFESSEFARAYSDLRDAVSRGWIEPAQLDIEYHDVPLGVFTEWTKVLVGYSRYAVEVSGDYEAQADAWRTSLLMTMQLERSRDSFLNFYSNIACRAFVAEEILIAMGEFDDYESILIPNGLFWPDEDVTRTASKRFAGSYINLQSEFDRIFVADGGWLDVATTADRYRSGGPTFSRLWNLASPVFFDHGEAEDAMATLFKQLDQCSSAKDLRREFGEDLDQYANDAMLTMSVGFFHFGCIIGHLDTVYRIQTSCEAAACVVALHAYRAKHGIYPSKLAELVPDHIPRVPIDFGDGEALRYRRIDDSYLLYSVGGDGVDNGGREVTKDKYGNLPWQIAGVDIRYSGKEREVDTRK